MRSTISALSKFIALLVAFILGFVSFAGALVGVGYLVYTKVSIDQLEEMGVIDIDTSDILSDDAEVSLTALTLQNLVSEIQHLASMKDEVSITLLTNRYGLKLNEDMESYLSQEYRDMPLVQLFSSETVDKIMDETTVGELLGYEKIKNTEYDPENPDSPPEYIWRDNGVELAGLTAKLASYTIKDAVHISPDALMEDMVIADVLNLSKKENLTVYIVDNGVRTEITDIDPIVVWCDENGAPSDGIINALAGFGINDIKTELDTLRIADITGLVAYQNNWYRWKYIESELCIELTLESDITTELAHVTIAQVSNGELQGEIEEVEISAFLGYTKDGDKWLDETGTPVSGIMASIADYKVGELDTEIGNIQVGELANYTYDEGTSSWVEIADDGTKTPATGILAALADLTVDQMTDEEQLSTKIQTVTVADAMGYYVDADGKVYKSSENREEITGFMAVIANEEIGNIETSINDSYMGDMLGYTLGQNADGNDWWMDSNGDPVHVMMNSIANTKFENVDSLSNDLTIADVIPAENLDSGFLQLMDPATRLDEIGESVNDTFNNATLSELMGENDGSGVIQIERADELDLIIGSNWREQKLSVAFDFIVGALIYNWEYYTVTVKTSDDAPVSGYEVTITDGMGNYATAFTDASGTAVIRVDKKYNGSGVAVMWQISGSDVEFTYHKEATIIVQ